MGVARAVACGRGSGCGLWAWLGLWLVGVARAVVCGSGRGLWAWSDFPSFLSLADHMPVKCNDTYIIITSRAPLIKLPDTQLKFKCNFLHSNVDFYFKYAEYSKFKFFFLTALDQTGSHSAVSFRINITSNSS